MFKLKFLSDAYIHVAFFSVSDVSIISCPAILARFLTLFVRDTYQNLLFTLLYVSAIFFSI